ncbi:MAG: universal stress protein [Henriciella sp.]|nr:universal stress protein [Henriciella sp.]
MSVIAMLGDNPTGVPMQMKTAVRIARRMQTSLLGLTVMPDPATAFVYTPGADVVFMGAKAIEAVTEGQKNARKAIRAEFDKAVKEAGTWLRADYEDVTGSVAHRAAGAAMLSQALVFPKDACKSVHALNLGFEHALMEARLPIVLASSIPHEDETCLIAWDGSAQSARAVRMHMPLIRGYKRVFIAQKPQNLQQVNKASGATEPAKLKAYLDRYEVGSEIIALKGHISEGLIEAADTCDAGLIVMGAYGHNRLGEMIFGGTTRAMLSAPNAPALALMH